MEKRKLEFSFKNISFYVLGFVLIGLGVNLMNSAGLGVGAWDTVTINGRNLLNTAFNTEFFTIGMLSFIVSTLIMLTVLIYRKKAILLMMLIPILLASIFIDFWNIVVFNDYVETINLIQGLFYFLGIIVIPLGLVFVVKSNFPAFVFEEWTFMMSEIFKAPFQTTRTYIEIFGITLGTIFGVVNYFVSTSTGVNFFGVVSYGSIIFAFSIGPTLALFLRLFKVTTHKNTWKQDLVIAKKKSIDAIKFILKEITLPRVTKYALGMFVISLGVVLMLRSGLGMSSWDTLHNAINQLSMYLRNEAGWSWFPHITIGDATQYVAYAFTFMVIVLNRNFKYLLMAIPIFVVGRTIDLFNDVILVDFIVSGYFLRTLVFIGGLLLLPLGGSLLIISSYPAGVFDEFMLVVMRRLKTDKLIKIRVIMELTAVLVALVIGLIAHIGIGQINIGTLIFSLSVGSLIKMYLRLFDNLGLYEKKQIVESNNQEEL